MNRLNWENSLKIKLKSKIGILRNHYRVFLEMKAVWTLASLLTLAGSAASLPQDIMGRQIGQTLILDIKPMKVQW